MLKDIRRLRHCKDDRALIEGPHLVGEALAEGLELDLVLMTPDFRAGDAGRRLEPALRRQPLEVLPDLLEGVTDADSPRGVVAVARLPRGGVERLPRVADGVYLFLEAIQDPGNLGALARVAEAFGCAGAALSDGCAHPNHPRALRASAGSLLRLAVAVSATPEAMDRRLGPAAPRWIALTARGGVEPARAAGPGTLVVAAGSEGAGLSPALVDRCDTRITIPLAGRVESLNVAVAAALVLSQLGRSGGTGAAGSAPAAT